MQVFSTEWLGSFWSLPVINANLAVFLNLLGALALGLLVGYERSFHGRAAGMRTYGIVCMASAALTVFAGYPEFWYGGHGQHASTIDPTRVVQGIVTGVGFLGAGVIMKDGLNISGLTTAASIWASSAIGILVGIGFYGSAILLAGLSASLMMWGAYLENRLPARHAIGITLRFVAQRQLSEDQLAALTRSHGYELARQSVSIQMAHGQAEWRFVGVALDRQHGASMPELAQALAQHPDVEQFQLSYARN